MFSPPTYLSVGDEYDKHSSQSKRSARDNKAFVVSAKRHPWVQDACFSKFTSLSAGDPYRTVGFGGPFREQASSTMKSEGKEKKPPFFSPGVPHKSSGKGDYYGTFSEKNPFKHETEFQLHKKPADYISPRPNFYTNPPKKGTYGFPGLSIGKAGEIQYVSDPYDGSRRQESLKNAASKKDMAAPFCAHVHSGGYFNQTEHGFSSVYTLTKPLPPKKVSESTTQSRLAEPWVPASLLKDGINRFPEYQEDPYNVKERNMRLMQQKEREYKPWCPAGNDPYRHIYTKPIPYEPQVWNGE
ncbi:unnamed protein product [Phytomonas sp. Hart1]|nr:unnamed protein product [Phytomonas sp. Hart1]|eukprot:CCW69552.1 unnamed protein product [Phytomonas sp. isolate Hart1]